MDGDGLSAEGAWVVARAGADEIEAACAAAEDSEWSDLGLREHVALAEAWVADLLEHGGWVEDLELRFGLGAQVGEGWLERLEGMTLFLDEKHGAPADSRWLARLTSPVFCWDPEPGLAVGAGLPPPSQRRRPCLVMSEWSGLVEQVLTDALHELVQEGRPVVIAWGPELPELGEALGRSAAAVLPRGAVALLQRPPVAELAAALGRGLFGGLGGILAGRELRERLKTAFRSGRQLPEIESDALAAPPTTGGFDERGEAFEAEDWGPSIARAAFGREESLSGQAGSGQEVCLRVPERHLSAFTEALLAEVAEIEAEGAPVPPLDAGVLRRFRDLVIGALDEGATLIHGEVRGRRAQWGPVVLTNVEDRMTLWGFEGSVPVLALARVSVARSRSSHREGGGAGLTRA